MQPALEIKHLTKHYRDFTLNDICLEIPCGSIMGLIGENGAGKSTTIKSILGLIRPDSGSISIFGKDPIQSKADIGFVLDECPFHCSLTPKNISSILKGVYPKWDQAQFRAYLERFALPAEGKIKEFSRGMKMKLSICSALSHHPKLLVLDEATSGLDPVVRNEILDLLWSFIQEEDRAVLLSSHITSDLEQISDYITFLHQGRLVFSHPKDELLEHYGILKYGRSYPQPVDDSMVVAKRSSQFNYELLVRDKRRVAQMIAGHTECILDGATLEDIMLFYIREGERS